jgi:hypothetical protein
MNPYTGEIYETPEEISAAEARKEPLLYGDRELLEEVRPVLMNRAARRRQARIDARAARRKN